jgi:hypothetical protein
LKQQTQSFQPYFEIKEHGQTKIAKKVLEEHSPYYNF